MKYVPKICLGVTLAAAMRSGCAVPGKEKTVDMDPSNSTLIAKAEQDAHVYPIGETLAWWNPRTGNQGGITPTKQATNEKGEVCREYDHKLSIWGEEHRGYGFACLRDSQWV